jgi:hypothetical protein
MSDGCPIRLIYVENVRIRRFGMSCQRLTFMISVSVPGPWKTVEVHWAGEEGRWRSCPAVCERLWGGVGEVWRARILRERGMDEMSLPGDVRFALCCRVDGVEYWDNNGGEDYLVRNDSGIRMASSFPLLRVGERPSLGAGESVCPVPVAVQQSIRPGRVFVRWTLDQWRTQRTAPCFFLRRYWSRMQGCNARNPNSYGCGIWLARLPVGDAPSVEFAIGCESAQGPVWDNNSGQDYVVRRGQLKVLTLNLHCRQEANQDAKLRLIASAIDELGLDLICLQEVSEPWNEGRGDWSANTARMICAQLRESYSIDWDYSHVGFGRYREGCAVLSRFPMVESESAYMIAESWAIPVEAELGTEFGRRNEFGEWFHLRWGQIRFAIDWGEEINLKVVLKLKRSWGEREQFVVETDPYQTEWNRHCRVTREFFLHANPATLGRISNVWFSYILHFRGQVIQSKHDYLFAAGSDFENGAPWRRGVWREWTRANAYQVESVDAELLQRDADWHAFCLFLIGEMQGEYQDSVIDALIGARRRGVDVRILLNGHMARQGDPGRACSLSEELARPLLPSVERLKRSGVCVDLAYGQVEQQVPYCPLHSKYCVVDNRIVLEGSFNWYNTSVYSHDLLVVVARDSVARHYLYEFEQIHRLFRFPDAPG